MRRAEENALDVEEESDDGRRGGAVHLSQRSTRRSKQSLNKRVSNMNRSSMSYALKLSIAS